MAARNAALRGGLAWLSFPVLMAVFVGLWIVFDGNLVHSNVDRRFRSFARYFLPTVQIHNLHHARDRLTQDTNYSGSSAIWDVLFGTFRHPNRVPVGPLGIDASPVPAGFLAQLAFPFRKQGRMGQRSRARSASGPFPSDRRATATGEGGGSFVGRFGPVYLQGDVTGDDVNWNPDATNIGGGGHLGLVDPNLGLIGASGSYQTLDFGSSLGFGTSDTEFWRVGGEGELFLCPATLGVNAGFINNTDVSSWDGYYARGLIRFYPTENLKLEGIGGVTTLDSDVVPHARALVEFKPDGLPLGFFVRWEGAFDNLVDEHFAVAGLRIYLDGLGVSERTLRDNDRIYFRDACTHTLLLTRTC